MLRTIRTFIGNYRLTWRSAPFPTFASTVLTAVDALWPTAFTIVSGLVIGAIPGPSTTASGPPAGGVC